jgi:peptidylprolyl isomerase
MTRRKKPHIYQQKHQSPQQQPNVAKRKSRKKLWILLGLLAIFLIVIGGYYMSVQGTNQPSNQNPNPTATPSAIPSSSPPTATPSAIPSSSPSSTAPTRVLLHTNMGDITIELRTDMPITTGNFRKLVQQGTYNGVIFHRVIPGFMIQGGDPTGTGYGDPSIPTIQDEFTSNNHNSGSSQFFINVVNDNYLDTKHPVFGTVVSGMDVVDKIVNVPKDNNDKPLQNVTIITATILP